MLKGLFEGWHLVVLLIVVLLLFGGKRLPDAARGLGRSLRIFKSEIQELQDEGPRKNTAANPEPLEGRVVDGEPGRAQGATEQRRDA